MKLTINEILKATGGRLMQRSDSETATGVSTDTRTLKTGDLFFALHGERHDGHDYVDEALRKGASAVVVDRAVAGGRAVISVGDTLKALGDLAQAWRRRFPVRVIAITGSNGKTTTKDMTAAILKTRYRVLKTEGNFNNLIGLPLTLFRLKEEERPQVAVLEMGMNRPGEIDRLSGIAGPEAGVITNIARAHLEGLGSLARIAQAKFEMLSHLPEEGLAVLNADDPLIQKMKKQSRVPMVTFGRKKRASYRSSHEKVLGLKGIGFFTNLHGQKVSFKLPVPGLHNISNALAAIAVADHLGVPVSGMKKALAGFHLEKKRMEVVSLGKIDVINDCYNANPDSMEAALSFLKETGSGRRRVAILGDMLELGSHSARLHREVGAHALESGINLLLAVGDRAGEVVRGALRRGPKTLSAKAFATVEAAKAAVLDSIRPGDLILIKGSRGMKMEKITEALQERFRLKGET